MGNTNTSAPIPKTDTNLKKKQICKQLKAYYQSLDVVFDENVFNDHCKKYYLKNDSDIINDLNRNHIECRLVRFDDDFPLKKEPKDSYDKKENKLYVFRQCANTKNLIFPLTIPQSPFHSWYKLSDAPFGDTICGRNALLINDTILLSPNRNNKLYSFNIKSTRWSHHQFCDYTNIWYHVLCSSNDRKYLYLYYGCNVNILLIIDIETMQIIREIENVPRTGSSPMILSDPEHNDWLHLIGGGSNKNHFIINIQNEETKIVHTFDDADCRLDGGGIIYLPQRKCAVVLHGGIPVYLYDFKTRKWENTKIKVPQCIHRYFGYIYVSSGDNDYVVIFGGESKHLKDSDGIFIFDVNEMKFKRSKIKCPQFSRMNAVITRSGEIHLFSSQYHWIKNIADILDECDDEKEKQRHFDKMKDEPILHRNVIDTKGHHMIENKQNEAELKQNDVDGNDEKEDLIYCHVVDTPSGNVEKANNKTGEDEVNKLKLSPDESVEIQFYNFLKEMRMQQYFEQFKQNQCCDMDSIQYFDDETVRNDIGIKNKIHRKKFLGKCIKMKQDMDDFENEYGIISILYKRLAKYGIVTLHILCTEIKNKQDLKNKYEITNENQCDLLWDIIQQNENMKQVEGI